MSVPLLRVRGLSYNVGATPLVRDVDLDAHPGEVLVVVGPNGAGKSTLLRLLAGEIKPASGEILLGEQSLSEYSAGDLARIRAVLPQQTLLQFAFKAREVVLMGRNPHIKDGWPTREDGEIADRALARTETSGFALRSYPSLSGGEQSRVTLSRVLAQEAPFLLLDEPTSSLDVRHQEMVMQVARELATGGACVVVIIHDLNLAAAHADRIAVMQHGGIAACGTPAEVIEETLLSRVFECRLRVHSSAELPHPYVVPERPGIG